MKKKEIFILGKTFFLPTALFNYTNQIAMPLLMITGYPSSGKTKVAEKLVSQLEVKIRESGPKYAHMKVELVNDERLGIAKETYRGIRLTMFKNAL